MQPDLSPRPPTVDQDSRGIIDPGVLRDRLTLTRYPPGPDLDGLIDFFWTVSYRLPPGEVHEQRLLPHPCVNLSIAPVPARTPASSLYEATLTGVPRAIYTRRLAGAGWAVAARSTPGGFGALTTGSVAALTGRVLPAGDGLDLDAEVLLAQVSAESDEPARVAVLARHLEGCVARADPERVRTAREVVRIAGRAQSERSIRRLGDLARDCGVGVRTMQRLFSRYVGVSPAWVLRRYRLLEAAEAVRDGRPVVWAEVAADLGYSDQAHLVRDFRAGIGSTPAAYAARQVVSRP